MFEILSNDVAEFNFNKSTRKAHFEHVSKV